MPRKDTNPCADTFRVTVVTATGGSFGDRAERFGGGQISDGATIAIAVEAFTLVSDLLAELVQRRLRLRGGDLVGQGSPPPLRGGVVRLLHDALAVPAPWWAGPHPDAEMLGDLRVGGGDRAGAGVHHRRHPVEPPVLGDAAELGRDLVLGVGELRLLHRLTQHPTKGRPAAVIEHPAGEETQWDWVELPDPPAGWDGYGKRAYLLVGALSHSSKWRGGGTARTPAATPATATPG